MGLVRNPEAHLKIREVHNRPQLESNRLNDFRQNELIPHQHHYKEEQKVKVHD